MLTYKVQLKFGTDAARAHWVEQMRLVRECYNFASRIAFDEKLPFGMKPYHHRLYREERETFSALPAQMCIKVNQHVLSNYRTIRENKVELEKPLFMKRPAVRLDKRLYSRLTKESICLSMGDGSRRQEVKFVLYKKFDEMAAGTAIVNKNYLARRRRIRHNKSIFRRHKKKSHSARRKLKMLRRKEVNVSNEMCHIVANEILSHEGSVVVMEDLSKIKQRTSKTEEGHKRKRHNNRMSQVPFFRLRQILTYKAPLRGKRVETVPPQYTSQEDCRTGSKEGCKRQGCRFYTADGLVFDADWNAAINICNRKHPTPFGLPLDGRLNFVGRQCQEANRE